MAGNNRPVGRDRKVTGKAKDIYKRGDGLGTGPVGSSDGYSSKKKESGSGGGKRGGGGFNPLIIVIIAALLLGGGGSGLSGLLGGSSGSSSSGTGYSSGTAGSTTGNTAGSTTGNTTGSTTGGSSSSSAGSTSGSTSAAGGYSQQDLINALFGGDPTVYTTNSAEQAASDDGVVDTTVADGCRAKRTVIKGNGKDTVTILVYMCGADLESRSGMATSDLQEMAAANLGNINLIVYTGGCRGWRNNLVSSKVNQIYQVKTGGLSCLVKDAGTGAMTDPNTLASFVKWGATNFPADRMELIFWDHGSGSVSGYGYDEKNPRSGSMSLAGINQALKAAGATFDFIGFDCCLMATAENALMLNSYADYMIASEETEPGVGWYYTDWLTKFAKNTSMPTLEIGKNIVDDFVKVCNSKCRGQQTTLSVIDLAEFSYTVPDSLKNFANSISTMISQKEYSTVAAARNKTREFATSARIDQVDLINLCENLGNEEGKELAEKLRGAVKYNLCNNITKAEGVSIYFPYSTASKVDTAVNTYSAIGMDSSYGECIKEFASMSSYGQIAAGGTGSPLGSLLGNYGSSGSSSSSYDYSSDALQQLLGAFLGTDMSALSGISSSNSDFFSGRMVSTEQAAEYISENHLDATQLMWSEEDGEMKLALSDEQWQYIHAVDLNMFYDDGEGFIDFGLDNIYSFDENGKLVADTQKVWLSFDDQIVAYYHENTEINGDDYKITGRVPAMLTHYDDEGNEITERVNLIVVFDTENPQGYLAGARTVYSADETEMVAKAMTEVKAGDKLDFICDYYSYDGDYQDSYYLGDQLTVTDDLVIGNSEFSDQGAVQITYRLRDLYGRDYWTPAIMQE